MTDNGEPIRKTCKRWNWPWNAHELTFSCLGRRAFFTKDRTREYFVQAVAQAKARHRFHVWAYVIMPEHVHLVIWPARENYCISEILQSIKQSVSRRAVHWVRANNPAGLRLLATGKPDRPYQFWLEGGGYDRNIRDGRALGEMMDYIHNNPVKRGLVARPEDWLWSSARDWAELAVGPIPIDKQSCIDSLV
jgi:putative transposase